MEPKRFVLRDSDLIAALVVATALLAESDGREIHVVGDDATDRVGGVNELLRGRIDSRSGAGR
jgi:hypothetical protein